MAKNLRRTPRLLAPVYAPIRIHLFTGLHKGAWVVVVLYFHVSRDEAESIGRFSFLELFVESAGSFSGLVRSLLFQEGGEVG